MAAMIGATRSGHGDWLRPARIALTVLLAAAAGLAPGLGISQALAEGTELSITSPHDGQIPYLVVLPDPDGNSRRNPGLYAADVEGKYNLLLAGDVLRGGASQGVIEHLPLTKSTGRHEALVVVNGALYLVQQTTLESTTSPDNLIQIGSDALPIMDPLTGDRIELPSIRSLEDIQVYSAAPGRNGQAVLISVRGGSLFRGSSGLTFGLLVAPKIPGRPWTEAIPHPAAFLDSTFRDRLSLVSMLHKGSGNASGAISPRVLRSYGRPQPADAPALRAWRQSLRAAAEQLGSPAWSDFSNDQDLPYIDLASGELKLQSQPRITALSGSIYIDQVYDPLHNADRIEFPYFQESDGSTQQERGRLNLSAAGTDFALYHSSKSSAVIAQINGDLHYLTPDTNPLDGRPQVVLAKLFSGKVPPLEKLAFAEVIQLGESWRTTTLFVSSKAGEEESTEAFILHQRDANISVVRRLRIFPKCISENELLARIKYGATETEGAVLFDNLTESTGDVSAYRQSLRPTIPYLDVSKTATMSEPRQKYIQEVEKHEIAKSVAYFRYDPIGAVTPLSGIAIRTDSGDLVGHQVGELLTFPGKGGNIQHIQGKRTYVEQGTGAGAQLTVFSMDSAFENGARAFTVKLLVTFSHGQSGSSNTKAGQNAAEKPETPAPIIIEERFNLPFEQLEGIQMVQGGKGSEEEFYVFFSFMAGGEDDAPGGLFQRTISFPKASPGSKFPFTLESKKLITLSPTYLSLGDLEPQLQFSKNGKLFWIATPELQETDSAYKVRNLSNGEEILRNSPLGRNLGLVAYSQGKGNSESGGVEEFGGGRYATWKHYGPVSVRKYFAMRGHKISDSLNEKEIEEQHTAFPGLNAALEDIANPAKPARHVVFIVPHIDSKLSLINAVTGLLNEKKNHHWNTEHRSKFDPFVFQVNKDSQSEILDNLNFLRGVKPPKKAALIADAADLAAVNVPSNPESLEDQTMTLRSPTDPTAQVAPHALYLLGTEGERVEVANLVDGRPPFAFRSRMVIIATMHEWRTLKQQLEKLGQEPILASFELQRSYYSLSWRLWGGKSSQTTPEIKALSGQELSDAEERILPNLIQKVEALADPAKPARHRVLIVPEDLKPFVRKTLLARWANADPDDTQRIWSAHNPRLRLHSLSLNNADGKPLPQSSILAELEAMRDLPGERSVLLVDAANLANSKAARPTSVVRSGDTSTTFMIEDYAAKGKEGAAQIPHILYLLAADGHLLKTEEFERRMGESREISQIILATEREWATIERDTLFEQRFGVLKDFELERIEAPNAATKIDLLERALLKPQVKVLSYQFDPESRVDEESRAVLSAEEKRIKVLSYTVSRTESLARQFGQEPTGAFLRVLRDFERAIVEDPSLRATRIVSKSFIERLLAKAFGIPLNLNILPPDDPLIILSKEDKAAHLLQQAGYEGPLDIKLKYIRAINSQTRSAGDTRNIPSSIVIVGDSSTGKTYLFRSLVKMLGLKYWDFHPENAAANDDAEAMILDFKILRAEGVNDAQEPGQQQTMTPKEAKAEIEKFIASPRGFRGYLMLDDVHKAPPEVRWEVLSYVLGFFDAPNGIVNVRGADGSVRPVSLRNFNIQISLNPPDDPEQLAKLGPNVTDEQLIVARLRAENCPFDISVLKRFTAIMSVYKFPASAKAPKLRNNTVDAARNEFNLGNKFVMVAPQAVRRVVDEFKDTNAREFLGEATSRLFSLTDGFHGGSAVFVIIPRTQARNLLSAGFQSGDSIDASIDASGRETDQIARFIQSNLTAVPVGNRFVEGKLHLLGAMLDSFRTTLYEITIAQFTSDPRFAKQGDVLLGPLLHAVTSNLLTKSYIGVSQLRLDPIDFGLTSSIQQEQFRKAMAAHEKLTERFFPIRFADELTNISLYEEFVDHRARFAGDRGRLHSLTDASRRATEIARKFLAAMLRMDNTTLIPRPDDWLKGLSETEPQEAARQAGRELSDLFISFFEEISSANLIENQQNDRHLLTPTPYDLSRLYMMAIDRAIMELPWGRVVQFMAQALDRAARETDLGQLPGTQKYLFGSKYSLVRPATHEGVMMMAAGSDAFKRWDQAAAQKRNDRFNNNCEKFFAHQ